VFKLVEQEAALASVPALSLRFVDPAAIPYVTGPAVELLDMALRPTCSALAPIDRDILAAQAFEDVLRERVDADDHAAELDKKIEELMDKLEAAKDEIEALEALKKKNEDLTEELEALKKAVWDVFSGMTPENVEKVRRLIGME